MLDSIPPDVWTVVQRHLLQSDLAALACTSTTMASRMRDVLEHRGLRLSHSHLHALDSHAGVRHVRVRGPARRYGPYAPSNVPVLRLPPLARLRTLSLVHPRLPAGPFWGTVLASCPDLRHVTVLTDFFMNNYAPDVHHMVDLVTLGAPRLHTLDIEGGGMAMYPSTYALPRYQDITAAVQRVETCGPTSSTTLRRYRAVCRQAPLPVNAALEYLEIDEPHDPPHLAPRMGPVTMAQTTSVKMTAYWPRFDAGMLSPYARLRDLDLTISATTTPDKLDGCLATLGALPAGLERLRLRFQMWWMRAAGTPVTWGRPLGHLDLAELAVDMLFPPDTVAELLGGWMGVRDARSVRIAFEEPASRGWEDEIDRLMEEELACSEDDEVQECSMELERSRERIDSTGLRAWLDSRPGSVVYVHNLPRLECDHPRCVTV